MHRPELIIFDLDGTLVDSFPAIQLGLNRALQDLGLPQLDLAWVRRHVGRGASRLIEAAAGGRCDAPELMGRFRHHYGLVVADSTPPYVGVERALATLSQSFTLAIASNKPLPWVDKLVDHLGWRQMMAAVVGPEAVGAHKPDPAMIRIVLERTDVSASRCLLVGDMPVDAETGANAGIPVVGVDTGSCSAAELVAAGCVDVIPGVPDLARWIEDHGE